MFKFYKLIYKLSLLLLVAITLGKIKFQITIK